MVALIYYVIFGSLTLVYRTITLSASPEVSKVIGQYFICEAGGLVNECDRSRLEELQYPGLLSFIQIIAGLVPFINLTFVIQWLGAYTALNTFWTKKYVTWTTTIKDM